MSARAKQVVIGLLFWIVFAIPAVLCLLLQPVGILLYALGNDNIRAWVYRTGKAIDQFNNAAWFGGDPKETISSHTGRYILSGKTLPWRFEFVAALTDLFEPAHCVNAVEEPFKDQPL
jgi:hypothetical protein